nr:uncharacterized protein LOC109151061 [Ipomoea trifida]
MAFDLRHILSGCLTAAMILMLCNMIKKDHIDPLLGDFSIQPIITPNNGTKSSSDNGRHLTSSDPWGVNNTPKPQESEGFVFVTLAQDPEYHISQIATAIVVAKYLGAALVIPNLRQSDQSGQKRMFGEIYDLEKFIESLDEKVMAHAMDSEIAKIYNQRVTTVKVPNMVSLEFIKSNIEPIFKSTRNLRLSIYFPSTKEQTRMSPYGCLGRFVVVDYKVVETMPQSSDSSCPLDNTTGIKHCFDAKEIAHFLKKIGFENGTTIYLTLNGWHTSIEHLRKVFPNTFTKDAIIPADEKSKFLDPERPELRQIVDFYVSSAADVYVPTSSSLFSDNVVARRIATGKRQVLVPANRSSLSAAEDYVPPYISEKEHWAYSCFC